MTLQATPCEAQHPPSSRTRGELALFTLDPQRVVFPLDAFRMGRAGDGNNLSQVVDFDPGMCLDPTRSDTATSILKVSLNALGDAPFDVFEPGKRPLVLQSFRHSTTATLPSHRAAPPAYVAL